MEAVELSSRPTFKHEILFIVAFFFFIVRAHILGRKMCYTNQLCSLHSFQSFIHPQSAVCHAVEEEITHEFGFGACCNTASQNDPTAHTAVPTPARSYE